MELTTDLKMSIWKIANLVDEYRSNELNTVEFENTMLKELEAVKNLNLANVSVAVFCHAPEHIKPCRHEFSGICQYNGHCNFKTER